VASCRPSIAAGSNLSSSLVTSEELVEVMLIVTGIYCGWQAATMVIGTRSGTRGIFQDNRRRVMPLNEWLRREYSDGIILE
jgi:hypothetical protein